MKIRNGFVSNSSTSSFCIYGTCMNEEELIKKLKASDYLKKDNEEEESREELWKLEELEYFKENNLCLNFPPYDEVFIGRGWSTIKDDETGLDFKNKTKKAIENLLGEKTELSTCEEAWRDG